MKKESSCQYNKKEREEKKENQGQSGNVAKQV